MYVIFSMQGFFVLPTLALYEKQAHPGLIFCGMLGFSARDFFFFFIPLCYGFHVFATPKPPQQPHEPPADSRGDAIIIADDTTLTASLRPLNCLIHH